MTLDSGCEISDLFYVVRPADLTLSAVGPENPVGGLTMTLSLYLLFSFPQNSILVAKLTVGAATS